jgi:UDP-N-acetylmuramoyl-L-alanyl-D-glutamate--2,6-diaminopimelate ligase
MANLHDILYKVRLRSVSGSTSIDVTDVAIDSRTVTKGCCFIAIKGTAIDGHDYIYAAIEAGAIAVVCEQMPSTIQQGVTYIQVEDSASAAGFVAHQFFGEPSGNLHWWPRNNGKTNYRHAAVQLFTGLGYACGSVSTVRNMIGDKRAFLPPIPRLMR